VDVYQTTQRHVPRNCNLCNFESWEDVFDENEPNIAFQTFLNIFLRYFYNSFPISYTRPHSNTKAWITSSIKSKCSIKRNLYLRCKEDDNPKLQRYYRTYCKVLTRNILEAKRSYYDKLIRNSKNRTKPLGTLLNPYLGGKQTMILYLT
jgi:hypothetical protein